MRACPRSLAPSPKAFRTTTPAKFEVSPRARRSRKLKRIAARSNTDRLTTHFRISHSLYDGRLQKSRIRRFGRKQIPHGIRSIRCSGFRCNLQKLPRCRHGFEVSCVSVHRGVTVAGFQELVRARDGSAPLQCGVALPVCRNRV